MIGQKILSKKNLMGVDGFFFGGGVLCVDIKSHSWIWIGIFRLKIQQVGTKDNDYNDYNNKNI